jgi:hypothetical protein
MADKIVWRTRAEEDKSVDPGRALVHRAFTKHYFVFTEHYFTEHCFTEYEFTSQSIASQSMSSMSHFWLTSLLTQLHYRDSSFKKNGGGRGLGVSGERCKFRRCIPWVVSYSATVLPFA